MQFDLGRFAYIPGPHRVAPALVVAAFVFTAMLAGIVVASGNVKWMGVAVGALVGVLLINSVRVSVGILLVGTLVVSGPVMLFLPELTKLTWLVSMLGFVLLLAALMHAGTVRYRPGPPMPAFIWFGLAFFALGILSMFYSGGSLEEGVRATKRYYSIWGLMFALAFAPLVSHDVWRIGRFLVALAVIQVPMALYQRVVLVPMRENMPKDVVPIDVVSGTFEATMWGGGQNSVMVLLCIAVFTLLVALLRDKAIGRSKGLVLIALSILPLMLGETKIVVALLPIALSILFFDWIRVRPFLFIGGGLVVAALSVGLFLFYSSIAVDARPMTLEQRIDENLEYNFGNRGYYRGGSSLNRFNAIPFWYEKQSASRPLQAMFGNGLGSSHGSEGTEVIGHMDKLYPGTVIGLIAASAILWDLGIVGLGLYAAMLIGAVVTALRLAARASPGPDRAMCRALGATAAMMVIFLFYSDAPILITSLQTIMATTLGLLAWRARRDGGLADLETAPRGHRAAAVSQARVRTQGSR